MNPQRLHRQQGIMLIEAIIGMLIFLIGVLAMLALQGTAIAVQSDAQYRIEAAKLAERMLADINLGVDRTSAANVQISLAAFQHQPVGNATSCNYSGAVSANAKVTSWVTAITTTPATRLPGATAASVQILVNTANFNQVTIHICWQTTNDKAPRRHAVTSYIN